MPASRQSQYKERYGKLLDESVALVRSRDFTAEELAQTAEDAFPRVPGAIMVPIDNVEPNPDNPRRNMAEAAMHDLAASIAERGLLQPLVVRRDPNHPSQYVVIAGSRRLLAARLIHGDPEETIRARVAHLPCIIKEVSAHDAFADALLENLARADLSRAEMMEALLRLQRDYGWSANYIAKRTGRNQSDISHLLGVARDPDLSQLVRQEVIKPTVAEEINRLPERAREATIADVKAGTVRTVADVRRRRLSAAGPVGQASVPSVGGEVPILPDGTASGAGVVISLPPVLAAGLAAPMPTHAIQGMTDRVIALPPSVPAATLREQIDAIGGLAALVDAATPAGQAVLASVAQDLAVAYDKLAAYLARHDK
jgi:ParB family chromosome partitioning protein